MTAKEIPLEVLLGNPEKASPRVSPDGKRMAYIAPVDGVLNVWVGTIGSGDHAPVTNDTERGIRSYSWCHDNKHILYTQDKGGDENWRIYTVDLDSRDIVDRTPFEGVQAQIIAHRKEFPNEILIGINKDNPQLHDVYHLDLRTAALEKIADNPGFVAWVVDSDLKVRGAVAPQPDGGLAVLVRDGDGDGDGDEWRPLVVVPSEDAMSFGPVGFTKDGSGMYLLSAIDANAARLVRMDVASGEVSDVLAEDPIYDVVGVDIHPETRAPRLVTILKERIEHVVLDPAIADDIETIKSLDPGDFHLSDRDHSDRVWVVAFDHDAGPVKFYVYDRDSKEATFLFDHRSELNDYTLAPMEPFSFKASDGLEIHGYLTFPAGERENLPTVINVHGGPWYRDSWGLDLEAQWLANRGYLSVQLNFRGSLGYGKDFVNAGDREWGGKMQQDVTDAVRWVVEQGYADPDRVAIMGGSYGGYATLVGATFTPELYRCAIAQCGPSNLKTFIEGVPPYWLPMIAMMHKRVGNPETDEDFLWSRSPLSRVDNISIPLFIGHGANDPRVKLAETEQIVEAMKAKGIPHELMVCEDEGHGFVKPENRLEFYKRAEEFLAKHL